MSTRVGIRGVLMATNPRVNSAIEGEIPSFTNVMLHKRDMFECFGDLYSEYWRNSELSLEIKEMTRIRNARITDCGY